MSTLAGDQKTPNYAPRNASSMLCRSQLTSLDLSVLSNTILLVKQLVRFGVIGGIATAIQYTILVLLVQLSLTGPILASAIGFLLSALVNYALNYTYTFKSQRSHASSLPIFYGVASVGLALNTLLMYLLVISVGIHYVLSQVITTVLVTSWNFFANRKWTF